MQSLLAHLRLLECLRLVSVKQDLIITRITPLSGISRKFRQRRSVVFPLPDDPMIERTSPCSREKLISLSTSVLPNFFFICSTSNIAIAAPPINLYRPSAPQRGRSSEPIPSMNCVHCGSSYLKKSSFFSNLPSKTVSTPFHIR